MHKPKFQAWQIFLIILLEGFVTISVEILSIRQLIPFAGNSIIITSLIIGIFLLFLAYGYQSGGQKTENLFACLQRNFLIAAVGIGFGLSFTFIYLFFDLLNSHFGILILWTLILYLCLIIAPIVYFLGQTVPITMSLLHQQESMGALGGKVLHLSTIGSFLGSVLTTLLLMNFLGVAWTVIINFLILAGLIFIVTDRKKYFSLSMILIVLSGMTYMINRGMESNLLIATTPYANYDVTNNVTLKDGRTGKLLEINNSSSSFIDTQKKAFSYIEKIKQILFTDLKITNKDILVLGAGGFTLSAENTFGNRFTYVDIDPEIYSTVQQHFLKNIQGNFVTADARRYIQEHPNSYDVIVSDAYSNRYTIPNHLLTVEHFSNINKALKKNGLAVINIIASPLLDTPYAKRADNTIRAAFSSCTASPLNFTYGNFVNILYVCQKNTEAADHMIYTDDLNRSGLDYFKNR